MPGRDGEKVLSWRSLRPCGLALSLAHHTHGVLHHSSSLRVLRRSFRPGSVQRIMLLAWHQLAVTMTTHPAVGGLDVPEEFPGKRGQSSELLICIDGAVVLGYAISETWLGLVGVGRAGRPECLLTMRTEGRDLSNSV